MYHTCGREAGTFHCCDAPPELLMTGNGLPLDDDLMVANKSSVKGSPEANGSEAVGVCAAG